MKKIIILFTFLLFLFFISCSGEKKEETSSISEANKSVITPQNKIDLWNGKDFSGWKLFVPDAAVDVKTVWMVKDGLLHCTGIPNGYIRTENDYSNYKLTVEWRWPGEVGNSGVLLHMSEPDVVWPKSIEAQLMSENAGDFWLIGGTEVKEHIDKSNRRIVKKEESSETIHTISKNKLWHYFFKEFTVCTRSSVMYPVSKRAGVTSNAGFFTFTQDGITGVSWIWVHSFS